MDNEKIYTMKEACEYLRISITTLRNRIKEGSIDFIGKPEDYAERLEKLKETKKNGGRPMGREKLLFTKEQLDKYLYKQ